MTVRYLTLNFDLHITNSMLPSPWPLQAASISAAFIFNGRVGGDFNLSKGCSISVLQSITPVLESQIPLLSLTLHALPPMDWLVTESLPVSWECWVNRARRSSANDVAISCLELSNAVSCWSVIAFCSSLSIDRIESGMSPLRAIVQINCCKPATSLDPWEVLLVHAPSSVPENGESCCCWCCRRYLCCSCASVCCCWVVRFPWKQTNNWLT